MRAALRAQRVNPVAGWLFVASCALGSSLVEAAVYEALGVTEAVRSAALGLSVSGRVAFLPVREGDSVEKGDLLLHLDREAEALELKRRELLLEDYSQLRALRNRKAITERQVAAAQELQDEGAIARKMVEDEVMALQAITAELASLEAGKAREQVEVDIARQTYEARHLYAPFAGVVTKIKLQIGESLPANEPVIELADASRVRFIGAFDQTETVAPHLGEFVQIALPTHESLRGTVVFVSPVADPASGLVEVIAEFGNLSEQPVRPGLGGRMLWERAP